MDYEPIQGRWERPVQPRSSPADEVRVQPLEAAKWMLATVIAVFAVTAGVWFFLLGIAEGAKPGTDRAQARLSAARIALAAGGGAGAGVGLMLAFRRQQHQEKATVLTDRDAVERRINDRYTAAIDQLGSDKLDVRLGGIYALERVATDSPRDHPTIIDVLCTFVREHTRPGAPDDTDPVDADRLATDPPQSSDLTPSSPASDVHAALTVIRRRIARYDTRILDLHGADLRGANLYRANLYRANLNAANLNGLDLNSANLNSANLNAARLKSANLYRANLNGANLYGANLYGANLRGTDLRGTDLGGTDLRRTDLSDVRHNSRTRWPEGFTPPPSAEPTDPPRGDADT